MKGVVTLAPCAVRWCVCLADIGIVHPRELAADEELVDGGFGKCDACAGTGKCDECDGTGECGCTCGNGHACGHECDACEGSGDCEACHGSGGGVRVRKIAA